MIGALRVEAGMDTAVEALQQALALNPKALGTYLTLAAWHRRGGDDSQAEAVLHQAISAIPTAVEAWKTLADLAVERGDPAAASGYWQKLLAVEAASATFVGMQPSRNLYRNSLYRDAALAVAENEWRRLGDRESAQKWLAVAARFGAMDDRGRRLMEAIAAGRQ
jgi:tetratricopeptide (TPR) repeat protein